MIKHFLLCFGLFSMLATGQEKDAKVAAHRLIDDWHLAAAQADFDAYFNAMTADGIFIGTDAHENWTLDEFKAFSKPYFDRGKAWSFKSIERQVYLAGNIAYFDELLQTQMGLCRGSGVLKMTDTGWKIAHYVLSIAVPNENVSSLTALKADHDTRYADSLLQIRRKKRF